MNRKAGLTRRVLPQLFLVTLRKRYDTDAATLIGSAASALDKDRPEFWSASLYKGTGGAYFLAGSGGFRNQFAATQEDGTVKGGSKIVPLTSGDAQTWAEQHLDPTTIAANHRHRRLISGAGPPARACDGPLRAGTVAPRDRLVLVENDF